MPWRQFPSLGRVTRSGVSGHLAGLSDVQLVARALEVETLRKIDRPQPADLSAFRNIAVLAPHQDDELIGAGGLCALARQSGAALCLVFLTDGAERAMTDGSGRTIAPGDVAVIRQDEARAVCAELEAGYACIGIDNLSMAVTPDHVEALAATLTDFAPDVILLPWLFDSAPKHRLASHLLWLARRAGTIGAKELWGYQVNNGLFANRVLDITSVMERKLDLIRIYESQNSFLRRYDHQAMGLGAWNSRYLASKGPALSESYAELFLALGPAEFDTLVDQFYLADLDAAYCGNKKLVRSMTALQAALGEP